jgi:hypothetical protein
MSLSRDEKAFVSVLVINLLFWGTVITAFLFLK